MSTWPLFVPKTLRPKQAPWFLAFGAIAVVTLVLFAALDWWAGWSPGGVGGLSFGVLAALLFLFEILYAARRRLFVGPLKTGQAWLQVHVYGGTIAALFVLVHMGFRWPHGTFGLVLFGLTVFVTLSGIAGVLLQKIVPPMLTRAVDSDAILERIPETMNDLRAQARGVVSGGSDMLMRFYQSNVEPALGRRAVAIGSLMNARAGREKQQTDFNEIRAFLTGEDGERLERLRTIVVRKSELETLFTWQRLLRVWLLVHVPAAMFLAAAVVGHIAAVWRY